MYTLTSCHNLNTQLCLFLQENLELYLHQYRSLFSLLFTVFCLVLCVSTITYFTFVFWFFFKASLCFTLPCIILTSTFGAFSASVGLSFLQFTNMNSMRNLFIAGVALFLGLSVPEYFREYTAKALHGPAHTKAGWVSFMFHHYLYFSFIF